MHSDKNLLNNFEDQTLQVVGFGDGEEDRVVLGLGAAFEDSEGAVGVEGGGGYGFEQDGLR